MMDVMNDSPSVRLLLIDDDVNDLKRLVRHIRKGFPGAILREITDEKALDEATSQFPFDVVVSEYRLKWSDGLKVLKRIRRRFPHTPVIWVSSAGYDEAIVAGMKAGLTDYVPKRQLQRLGKSIRDSLEQAERCRQAAYALEALKAAEQRYRMISELTSDYAYLLHLKADGGIAYEWVSEGFTAMTGYPLETLARPGGWSRLIHPEDLSLVSQRPSRWLLGHPDVSEFRILTPSGQELWLRDYTCPLRDGMKAGVVRVYGAGQEITVRRRLEDLVRQNQKMEVIGRLAGGIAHDFNNLLQVISGYSDLLQQHLTRHGTLCRYVQEIKNVAEQGAVLTRQLMMVSRKPSFQPQFLDFERILHTITPMLRRLLGEDIELSSLVTPHLGQVTADPGQLEQVILNLAANARDAMPQGGRLTLEATHAKLDLRTASRLGGIVPGDYIKLTVSDTGFGMDAETQAHIFEPFFTTKEPGKGTGLGLFTVYGIVSQNRGNMQVESTVGGGTTFIIYWPRVDGAVTRMEPEPPPSLAPHGGETILLIEDEQVVRDLVRQVLQARGYAVLEATNGEQALLLSRTHQGLIHLLLTDVVLPGLSGPEVAAQLTSTHPDIRVIYMSGYAADIIKRHGISDGQRLFLQKPFTPASLLANVRAALEGSDT
jgi:PAS domain S-box-containing protein